MRNVLVLAYHYPPVGGAAVQRNAQLVRHLPTYGYAPVVVSGGGARPSRWTPRDDSLAAHAVGDFEVLRVAGEDEVGESGRWRGRSERWLGVETPWTHWWTHGVVEAARRAPEVDLVYAPLVPFGSFRGAIEVSRLLDKPLVVDLHDPWAFDEMMVYPSALHRRRDAAVMKSALAAANGVAVNTPEAARRILAGVPRLASKPLATIPNGYSADDFADDAPSCDDDVFRIVHTGYLHTELGREHQRLRFLRRALGGMIGDVDILTRSHVYLLEAVEELLDAEPNLAPVELHLAGVATPADREAAGSSKLVRFHGYVPHSEAVKMLRTADLLFLPMQNVAEHWRVAIVPGKTYEYLGARRPILAAVPNGDAYELLERAGNAAICRPDDVAGMREAVRIAIERKRRGDPPPLPDDDIIASLEWRNRARDLASLFDDTLASVSVEISRDGALAATSEH